MNHSRFKQYLKARGFAVTVSQLKKYLKNPESAGFSSHLLQFLEDWDYVAGSQVWRPYNEF